MATTTPTMRPPVVHMETTGFTAWTTSTEKL
ncbi:Uncharacterised protein [Mycobacteroides abscessus subsp. abscessus]|nr:Uncharacterised protein [Mycobacteroides abscessus subsp. abscessus]